MFYPLENFFRKLRRYFSRSERAVRRLHLTTSEKTESEHGLLLIQIDGLSKTQMERAMRRGRLPFLKSLLQKQKYEMHTFYSGLPSTTPAVQAELHYGVRCAVPAFSFLWDLIGGINVGAMIDCAGRFDLFGCHVIGRAESFWRRA